MTFESLMIHTCYLGSVTTTTNEFGESKETWTYSTTGTDCRFVPVKLEELRELGGDFQDITFKVYFNSGASVVMGDRIEYDSSYYTVRRRYYDSSGHHITCLVKEL